MIANLQKEQTTRSDDTVYYKNVFVDLFMTDPEFTRKFPSSGAKDREADRALPAIHFHRKKTATLRKRIRILKVRLK